MKNILNQFIICPKRIVKMPKILIKCVLKSPLALYGILYFLIILIFAGIYYLFPGLNNNDLTFIDAFYFSTVTITTLGYGDLLPETQPMRLLAVFEAVLGILTIGMFLSSLSDIKTDKNSKEQLNWLSGGDSIPWLAFSNFGYQSLCHYKGDYPIYDLQVELQEYWLPINDEGLPTNYFYKMKNEYPHIDEMVPFKNIDTYTKPIMLPNRLDGPFDKFIYNPEDTLFPETQKFMLVASFSARNGHFKQYIAGKKHSNGNMDFQTMLIDNEGKRHLDNGNWIKVDEISHPKGNKTTLSYFVYNWEVNNSPK